MSLAVSLVSLLCLSLSSSPAQQKVLPYRNPQLSVDARVRDLLSRMTLEEKFWQLFMVSGGSRRGEREISSRHLWLADGNEIFERQRFRTASALRFLWYGPIGGRQDQCDTALLRAGNPARHSDYPLRRGSARAGAGWGDRFPAIHSLRCDMESGTGVTGCCMLSQRRHAREAYDRFCRQW